MNRLGGPQKSLAVLGTGTMGTAMAVRWASQGFPVKAWNRSGTTSTALVEAGVHMAASVADAVAKADVIVTMLSDGAATHAVGAQALAAARPETVWLQMATVGPEATQELAVRANAAGVSFLDAPVSGTKGPAEQGKLVVLASGPRELQSRIEDVLAAVAHRVLWVGEVGAGSRLKLVLNSWLASLVSGLAESITLAEALDLDPHLFLSAIEGGPLGPHYANVKGLMMINRSYPTASALYLLTKDVALAQQAAQAAGVELPVQAAIKELLLAAEPDFGQHDMSAIVEALGKRRRSTLSAGTESP